MSVSMAHITTRKHGGSLVRSGQPSETTPMFRGYCIDTPAPHWRELFSYLPTGSTGIACPIFLVEGIKESQNQRHECGRANPTTCLQWNDMGTEVVLPLH